MVSCLGFVLSGAALACTTVEPGADFQIADVVFDENYYYCQVEPVLFASSCGPGEGSDPAGGCHFNVTSLQLSDYTPKVSESCNGNVPSAAPPAEAQGNYQSAQSQMRRDPDLAPLISRPVGRAQHPRIIFSADSNEAKVLRDWAEKFSSQ